MSVWWLCFTESEMRALQQAESARLGRGLTNAEAVAVIDQAVADARARWRIQQTVARVMAREEVA